MIKQWFNFEQIWQRSPFLRLLNQSLFFRVLSALLFAYLLLVLLSLANALLSGNCLTLEGLAECLEKKPKEVVSIESADAFSLMVVAILFIFESPSRRRQELYEAWRVIDSAAAAKVPTSFARIKAIQDLNQGGISLRGLDVPGADLQGINLYKADLREADFRGADLRGSILTNANLSGVNFSRANLTGAVLFNANLSGANLRGANLTGTNLDYANLKFSTINSDTLFDRKWLIVWQVINSQRRGWKLSNIDLSRAWLEGAYLVGADLNKADLTYSYLINANLTRAKLIGSDFTGAVISPDTKLSERQLSQINTSQATQTSVGEMREGKRHDLEQSWLVTAPKARQGKSSSYIRAKRNSPINRKKAKTFIDF